MKLAWVICAWDNRRRLCRVGESPESQTGRAPGQTRACPHALHLRRPTTGLHFDDINKLLAASARLIDAGGSLLVIEHNLDVIKTADYIIDLGPEGGDEGGYVVATGTPEEIMKAKARTPDGTCGNTWTRSNGKANLSSNGKAKLPAGVKVRALVAIRRLGSAA